MIINEITAVGKYFQKNPEKLEKFDFSIPAASEEFKYHSELEWTARILNGSPVTFLDFDPGDNYTERSERKQYPAVMEAWNNYKTLLDLARK